MTKCRFCAEDIQETAVVCRYCGRDLALVNASRWRRVALVIGLVLAAGVAAVYFGPDHQRFIAFSAERDAWHRKCDAHVAGTVLDPSARACQEELAALLAYAKQQGW